MSTIRSRTYGGAWVLLGTTVVSAVGFAPPTYAQSQASADKQSSVLEEVVVTAQKRAQSMQTVPVAVTALTKEAMEVNRIVNVNDLSGLAPNLTVRPAAGGVNLPAFTMRGITSYGVVAGSDKEISIYLDGVYIGSPRGSIFSLPDIKRIEVLRGPQGTLFGRNATGGAISIVTRKPTGQLGFRQKVSLGSRNYRRSETTIDLPAIGPFSAYVSYTREKQNGDIRNLGHGTFWDRSSAGLGKATSPRTLGATDTQSVFFSSLLQPTDNFTLAYKYDYSTDKGSPAGNVIVTGLYPEGAGAAKPLINALAVTNANLLSNIKTTRPKSVDNAFATNRDQQVQGHNLTATWDVGDSLVLKDILAYRTSRVFTPSDISGTSGWVVGAIGALLPGGPYAPNARFCYACSQAYGKGHQWSNELQINFDTRLVTLTSGAMWYRSEDKSGSPANLPNTYIFGIFPGSALPNYDLLNTGESISYNKAASWAVYSQGDFHVTPKVDLQVGARYTWDDKSGHYYTGLPSDPPTASNPYGGYTIQSFNYGDAKPSYLLGVNYRPTDNVLLYGKYSTSYVSGGSVAGFDFKPETAASWEIGTKGEYFDHRLRANLALFNVTYRHLQTAQAGSNVPGASDIGVLVVEGGQLDANGAELELTAMPMAGLTLHATLGYQNTRFDKVTDLVKQTVGAYGPGAFPNSSFKQTLVPKWNGNLSANYQTAPLIGPAYLSFGITGTWHDKIRLDNNPGRAAATPFGAAEFTPATWVLNARAAIKDIEFGDSWKGEIALWCRNLTDDKHLTFVTNFGALVSGTFQKERTIGVDFIVHYK